MSHHRLREILFVYADGPIVDLGVLVAILLWILIGFKLYRTHTILQSTAESGSMSNICGQVKDLYFSATVIFASLSGLVLGNAIYWLARKHMN